MNDPIWPKFELVQAFMPVLVTRKFDKDPIKGDWAKLDTSFFTAQGHVRYDRNLNSSEISCMSSLPVSLMKTEFKVTKKRRIHHFPHSKSMGTLKGEWLRSEKSDPAQIRTHPWFYACPRYLQVWQRSDWRWLRKRGTPFCPLYMYVNVRFLLPW